MTTTDIYRIKTRNSIYEIHVHSFNNSTNRPSRCRKEGESTWRRVSDFSGDYLEKLCIGPGFDIPGVVDTSNVVDYVHFVLSTEPKRKAKGSSTGIPEFFEMLAQQVGEQANPKAFDRAKYQAHKDAAVAVKTRVCGIDGCTVERVPGLPSHDGSRMCKSGSIESGGTRAHCSCDYCY